MRDAIRYPAMSFPLFHSHMARQPLSCSLVHEGATDKAAHPVQFMWVYMSVLAGRVVAGQLSRLSGARIDPSTPSLRTRESMMLSPGVGTPIVNSVESHGLAKQLAAAEKRKFSHESIALNSP